MLKADQLKSAAAAIMEGRNHLPRISPAEIVRFKTSALMCFQSLFPRMVTPQAEISAIVDTELQNFIQTKQKSGELQPLEEFAVRNIFEQIIK